MAFREIARKKQALSREDCVQVLQTQLRGVLSVLGEDGYPYGLPIDHFYDEETGRIYFHSGKKGHKVDALKKHDKVSYCVFDEGYRRDGEWALNIRSVIIFGRLHPVEDLQRTEEICRKLCRRFTDDEGYIEGEIRKDLKNTLLLELIPEHMTGKLVNES